MAWRRGSFQSSQPEGIWSHVGSGSVLPLQSSSLRPLVPWTGPGGGVLPGVGGLPEQPFFSETPRCGHLMRAKDGREEGPAQGAAEPELKLSWGLLCGSRTGGLSLGWADGATGPSQWEAEVGNSSGVTTSPSPTVASKILLPVAGAEDWHPGAAVRWGGSKW